MDSATAAKVIAAAISARAALDSLLLELTSELEATERAGEVTPDQTTDAGTMDDDGPRPCAHENKKQLGTFGSKEHWVCEDCGLEYRR